MPDALVTLLDRATTEEAHVLKNLLEAEGIEVFLEGELAGGMLWGASPNIGKTKVKVRERDFEQAVTIVRETQPLEDGSAPEDHQSQTESNGREHIPEETPLDQLAIRSFKAAVCGWFFIPLTFYSAYLIVRVICDDGEMKKRGMGIVLTAGAIDIATLFFYRFLLFSF
jgi:hypothetical protein